MKANGPIGWVFTDRSHGDLAVGGAPEALAARRAGIVDAPWTWLRQEHGAQVCTVVEPGDHAGTGADGLVTATPGAVLAVQTADCAPVLWMGDGVVGVAHAGWRGLVAGVIEATAAAMAAAGSAPNRARLGPCIRSRCYEFGESDLATVEARFGPVVRSTTASGTPALDVSAAVSAACAALGVRLDDDGTCTACSPNHWSHRARVDTSRQALVAWIQP